LQQNQDLTDYGDNMQVLLIDDSQINLTLLEHLIRNIPQCHSISFLDPIRAIEWCHQYEPDLVITDYMMPVMNGIAFSYEFRRIVGCETIPILMVTANHEIAIRHEALIGGVTDFLNKPLDNIEFLARVKNMLGLRQSHKQLAYQAVGLEEEIRKATAEIIAREQETIYCLARAAEFRDPETGHHIQRMSRYAEQIARCLGLSLEQQTLISVAAPMHDIGKIGIPDAILLKPDKLTPEEFKVMQQHALIGYDLLKSCQSPILKAAAEIAYSHHEKFDGSGYPRGLVTENIPLFGRIIAIADVFDALTSVRPYKRAWTIEEAFQFLQSESGKHFDPSCLEAFFSDWDAILAIKNLAAIDSDD
jgi:putative two-component system response regulator